MKASPRALWCALIKTRFRLLTRGNFSAGSGFMCGRSCTVSRKNRITIGDHFFMGNFCHLAADLTIGDDVMFASFVSIVGGDHRFDDIETTMRMSGRAEFLPTTIESNVWVGHGAIIMHGITIHSGAVIAAGAVVTRDVPPNAIVGGNPARLIRERHGTT